MLQSLTCCAQHLANTETTANSDASVLNLQRTTSRNHRNNRQLWCLSVLSLWPQCTLDRLLAFYKNRGMTVNGKTGCVASKSRAVIRHSLAASCSFCSSNTTPNKCLKESTTYLRTPKRACKPNLQIAILHAPLATSTKNEWKAAFGPSDTRNLIACILTFLSHETYTVEARSSFDGPRPHSLTFGYYFITPYLASAKCYQSYTQTCR